MAGMLGRSGVRTRAWIVALQQESLPCIRQDLSCNHELGTVGMRFSSSLAVKGSVHPSKRGTGGRSSVSGVVATVFGATGFLARYVVQQLAKMGSQVIVPYRGVDEEVRHLKLMGDLGQIVPMRYDVRDEGSIRTTIASSNIIVNCIGREYETRNFKFQDVNYEISNRLSQLAKDHGGISKYIQISCLGASSASPSKQLRTKAAAEEVTLQNFPEATIIRSGALVGTEDRLLNRWAAQAKKLPFVPLPGGGKSKVQPVLVVDVAAGITACIRDQGFSMGKTFELGGPDVFTINELVELMFETIRENSRVLHIPMPLARLAAIPRELAMNMGIPIPFPMTFYKDYLDQQAVDHIVSPEAMGFLELGITPHKIAGVAIEHLYAYRTGGPSVGTTVVLCNSPDRVLKEVMAWMRGCRSKDGGTNWSLSFLEPSWLGMVEPLHVMSDKLPDEPVMVSQVMHPT